jgi:hypothetical protein
LSAYGGFEKQPTKESTGMDTKIIEQLEACFYQEPDLARCDLGDLEATVRNMLDSLGKGLLQRLVERSDKGYRGSRIPCDCGGTLRFVGNRVKNINTNFGWIEVRRAYYHCAGCGKVDIPYDRRSGLGSEQISPGLARACCLLATSDSFVQTREKIKHLLGRDVSTTTIGRVVGQVGRVALSQQDKAQFVDEAAADRLYVVADGTTVHEKDGWHEAKAGCVYWDDKRFVRHKRYIAGFDNSEDFGRRLWLEAKNCGLPGANEVVYIGDGAGWIRSLHTGRFSRATFIIDWFHASEHIWNCGKTLFGEGTEQTKRWVQRRTSLLWDGWTRKLLKGLAKQRKRYRGKKREAIETLYHYISTNEEQMRYNVFRDKGYDIGSGAAEGACKHVVASRLKQSGMIWTRPCSSAVLALRVSWLNERWQELWLQKPLAA